MAWRGSAQIRDKTLRTQAERELETDEQVRPARRISCLALPRKCRAPFLIARRSVTLVQAMLRAKLLEEDALFDKYTHALVEQYKADGKDVKPLLLELAKMKAEGR